jgi:hypothetical protein
MTVGVNLTLKLTHTALLTMIMPSVRTQFGWALMMSASGFTCLWAVILECWLLQHQCELYDDCVCMCACVWRGESSIEDEEADRCLKMTLIHN